MKVFISWAQTNSQKVAKVLKDVLSKFFDGKIQFWMSEKGIPSGSVLTHPIFTELQESDTILLCIDSSNYMKPWIYFEAGAVFSRNFNLENGDTGVIGIVFDNLKDDRLLLTPLKFIQREKFTKDNMERVLRTIGEKYDIINKKDPILRGMDWDSKFEDAWKEMRFQIDKIYHISLGDDNMLNEENVVARLSHYEGFSAPEYGDVIRYSSGFETNAFYRFLLENTEKCLYIFGRKNSKLSSNDLRGEFETMLKKDDFDFKMLFMNPASKFAKGDVAQDTVNFEQKLSISIAEYVDIFNKIGMNINDYCRMYDGQREIAIIVADEVVMFKNLEISAQTGKPEHFTHGPFYVVAANSQIGHDYEKLFLDTWNKSIELKRT